MRDCTNINDLIPNENITKAVFLLSRIQFVINNLLSLFLSFFYGQALKGFPARENYEAGVQFGCWGLVVSSLVGSCFSMNLEKLVKLVG